MSLNRGSKIIVLLALIAVLVTSVFYLDARYRQVREAEIAAKFQLLGQLRRSALETYFKTAEAEISFWSLSPQIRESFIAIKNGWDALGDRAPIRVRDLYISNYPFAGTGLSELKDAGDGSAYSSAHAGLHELANEFLTGRGYYDFFLIDLDGNIIYSVEKEQDYATNLMRGAYSQSGLGVVFNRVLTEQHEHSVAYSDFSRYAPSNDDPAIFAARLLFDEEGNRLGVLALQLPTDTIVDIMHFTAGMGESGETYLVGGDLLMRSDSRFADTSTVLETVVDTTTVQQALSGERGVGYTPDYRGIEVLSAYDFIDIDGMRWAVMAEIDAAEVADKVGSVIGELIAAAIALFALVIASFLAIRDFGDMELANSAASTEYDADSV
ncbi:MAG: cache domain-containing protein [Gammaproteobacteria bacterium]